MPEVLPTNPEASLLLSKLQRKDCLLSPEVMQGYGRNFFVTSLPLEEEAKETITAEACSYKSDRNDAQFRVEEFSKRHKYGQQRTCVHLWTLRLRTLRCY